MLKVWLQLDDNSPVLAAEAVGEVYDDVYVELHDALLDLAKAWMDLEIEDDLIDPDLDRVGPLFPRPRR